MSNISIIGSKDGPAVDERELGAWVDQRGSGLYATPSSVAAAVAPKLDVTTAAATYAGLAKIRDGAVARLIPIADRSASMGGTAGGGLSNGTDTGANALVNHLTIKSAYNPRLIYGNYRGPDNVPPAPNDITVMAGATYGGTTFPVYFAGSRAVVIKPGQFVVSDPLPFDAIAGQTIVSRTYVSVTSGQKWPTGIASKGSDTVERGTSITDKSLTGAVAGTGAIYSPIAVIGTPKNGVPVIAILGDSIFYGTGDTTPDNGPAIRALNNQFSYYQFSVNGEQANNFQAASSSYVRATLLGHANHMITDYGINDLGVRTLAQLQVASLLVWNRAALRNVKAWQTTLLPYTSSTDSWATEANQTVDARESKRVQYNDWLRDGAPINAGAAVAVGTVTVGTLRAGDTGHPLAGYFDCADRVETARNSGKWITNGTANYPTTDGVHPSAAMAILAAAAIDTTKFTLP